MLQATISPLQATISPWYSQPADPWWARLLSHLLQTYGAAWVTLWLLIIAGLLGVLIYLLRPWIAAIVRAFMGDPPSSGSAAGDRAAADPAPLDPAPLDPPPLDPPQI